jgi:hypothetical protein
MAGFWGAKMKLVSIGCVLTAMVLSAGPSAANELQPAGRVVMALDSVKGEEPTGYEAVLLTGQTVEGHAVRVRVPDVPDLLNHTVTLRVYITDAKGTTSCNAGHLRIV